MHDPFYGTIYKNYAEALANRFFISGNEENLELAINILHKKYIEQYTKEEYLKLKEKQKKQLKQVKGKQSISYYEPSSFYLATRALVPEVTIKPEHLEILLNKIQNFEKLLLKIASRTFNNNESATLKVFNQLLNGFIQNEERYQYWSQRAKNHLVWLMDSNYITYDACRQIENFYDYLEKSNATHIASFRLWLETFHKNNCSKTLPLENFLNKYTTK